MTKLSAKPKVVRAAGGLVWRMGPGGKELVLVHRPAYDDWSFPKGKLDDGESEIQAALREVEEEVGIRCVLGRDLGTISYVDGKRSPQDRSLLGDDRRRPRHDPSRKRGR